MNLPAASILGVGAITPIGRDLARIADRLSLPASKQPSLHVDDELLKDPVLSKQLRRADRFTRMAVLAASDAWNQASASLADVPRERVGLIVSSGFGPHGRGFKFLDGLLDCGDEAALPTDFSHSVHGAPAAYITEILGLRGPSLSVTDFIAGFEHAVQLAQCWLAEGACDRVLVGAVEELGPVLRHCAGRMLAGTDALPGEGAVFFMLGRGGGGVANVEIATTGDGSSYTFGDHFGHHPSIAAFNLLAGLLASRSAVDNPKTFRPSCDPAAVTLLLQQLKAGA